VTGDAPWRMSPRAFLLLALVSCSFDSGGVASAGDPGVLGSETGSAPGATSTTEPDPTAAGTGDAPMTTAVDDGTSSAASSFESGSSGADPSTSTGEPEGPTCNGVPIPDLPSTLGPVGEVSLSNVRFPDSGKNITRAAPRGIVVLEFDYEVASCDCVGCVTQGMLGVVDGTWRDCFYDGVPGCGIDSGAASLQVQVPELPGFYLLSFWRTWEYGCEFDSGAPNPDDAIAGVCVVSR
jgi:hypothetical protein